MKIDILLPLHKPRPGWENEIVDAIRHLQNEIGSLGEIHLYVTNDGAPDEYYPAAAIQQVSDAVNGNFYFLKYEKNRGKGYCLRHMVKQATGDYIVYTDGDFPFGWQSVADCFKELLAGADVTMGRRSRSYGKVLTPFRKCLSGGLKLLNRIMCGLPEDIQDTQAGLKGFNRRGQEVFLMTKVDSFVFDTEFILLAWRKGLKITPVDVQLKPGLKLSSMGYKVLFRELFCFSKVLWRVRVRKCYLK